MQRREAARQIQEDFRKCGTDRCSFLMPENNIYNDLVEVNNFVKNLTEYSLRIPQSMCK